MAATAPSSFDPSIPLQVKGPLDQLGGMQGALGFAARNQLGQLASQAVGSDGQVDYDKFLSLVMRNPLTAGFAGQEISQLRQAQLSQAQLASEQQKQMGTLYGQLGRAALAARDPGTFATLLSSTVASAPPYVRQQAGPMVKDLITGLTSNVGVDQNGQLTPQGLALWNERRQQLAALLGANADTRFAAFAPSNVVQGGWGSMGEAAKPVPGPVTPGGAPTTIPAATFAAQQGFGGNALSAPQGGTQTNTLSPPAPVKTDLSPGQKTTITGLAEEYKGEEKKQYDNAVNLQGRLVTTQHDLDQLVSGSPSLFTNPGTAAESRMALGKAYNTFLQSVGAPASYQVDPTKIGSMEELLKEMNLNGFSFMNSMMGAQREAASIVQAAIKSVPGANNSPLGMQYLINTWQQLTQRMIDQRRFETNWIQDPKHDGSLVGAKEAFDEQYTPEAYAYRAISNTKDPLTGKYPMTYSVKTKADLKKYLPGTVVRYPDGSLRTVTPDVSGMQVEPITLKAGTP